MAILGPLHIPIGDVRVEIWEFPYKKIIFQEISQNPRPIGNDPLKGIRRFLHIPYGETRVKIGATLRVIL
jgi:hypothetical protein